jgi:hypothetical protein
MSEKDKKDKESSIFSLAGEVFKAKMEETLFKARSSIASEADDANYQKGIYRDFTFANPAVGYYEPNSVILMEARRQMAHRSVIAAGIIRTRQAQFSKYTQASNQNNKPGWMIKLKDEPSKLEELIEGIKQGKIQTKNNTALNDDAQINKAFDPETSQEKDIERMAQEMLKDQTKKDIKELTQFIMNCGKVKDRPFESRKWNFKTLCSALLNDSLSCDWMVLEKVPEEGDDTKIHHFVPIDAVTVRYASTTLGNYKTQSFHPAANILYPEKELEALERKTDAVKLDPEKLENNDYKYVQLIKGVIERAFTPNEMSVGVRNPITDIYANGYGISELELLATTISSHLFAENHKRKYFTNGFSAKGILHIKAPLNRRKMEALRIQWKHTVSGPKNSFQTPIFAGMDDVKWIPLNQGDIDKEFNNWMQYLIKVMCMIYQIDASEIGFGMKEEGSSGNGLSGDNTAQKIEHSKDKGLLPLIRFMEDFINTNIMDYINSDYKLEFTGISEESSNEALARQEKEVKFKKSVNEVRSEEGLPPIPGADNLILDPVYFQWFSMFSEEGRKVQAEMAHQQEERGLGEQIDMENENSDLEGQALDEQIKQDSDSEDQTFSENENQMLELTSEEDTLGGELPTEEKVKKAITIEYYEIKDNNE